MRELYVFCEGETEQGFCNQVLRPHLFPHHEGRVHTIRVAHSKHHGIVHRGGVGKYAPLRRDIQNELKRRRQGDLAFTTMIDLYKIPKDFPGRDAHALDPGNPAVYVEALERAFGADVGDPRFIPYLQLHEYETLLFADPEGFRIEFDGRDAAIAELHRVAASETCVELIDDGESTAPSKRIIALIPEYAGLKRTAGPNIAEFIGLAAIRAKCPHFHAWVERLEALAGQGA